MGPRGSSALGSGEQDLAALAVWAVVTVALWWLGRFLRRRFGRGHAIEPGQRDRTIAAAIDGVGLVLVPILAVWLIGKLVAATSPPPPIDALVPELIIRVIVFLLVIGLTATALSPRRPAWRVLPFSDGERRRAVERDPPADGGRPQPRLRLCRPDAGPGRPHGACRRSAPW